MGHRTVVVLYNDHAHQWSKDPELGRKIMLAMHDRDVIEGHIGRVIECTHADDQTLMLLDSYNGTPVAHGMWSRLEDGDKVKEKMLRDMADRLGFRVVRKTANKAR